MIVSGIENTEPKKPIPYSQHTKPHAIIFCGRIVYFTHYKFSAGYFNKSCGKLNLHSSYTILIFWEGDTIVSTNSNKKKVYICPNIKPDCMNVTSMNS